MNEKIRKIEKLYDSLTNIDDEMIIRAGQPRSQNNRRGAHKKVRFRTEQRKPVRWLVRIATVCVLCMAMFVTALAASPELRQSARKLAERFYQAGVDITFQKDTEESNVNGSESEMVAEQVRAEFGWLPEGGIFTEECSGTEWSATVEYSDGSVVTADIIIASDTCLTTFDEEGCEKETISVHGCSATVLTKENRIIIWWYDEENEVLADVITYDMAKDDALRIAEELTYAR